jgi:hypothetical protein
MGICPYSFILLSFVGRDIVRGIPLQEVPPYVWSVLKWKRKGSGMVLAKQAKKKRQEREKEDII